MNIIKDMDHKVSYEQFAGLINMRREYYNKIGLKSGDMVLLDINNTIENVIDFVSLMLSEIVVVPIDELIPLERKKIVKKMCDIKTEIISGWYKHEIHSRLMADYSKIMFNLMKPSQKIAYIIFTTGTTGTPKGVRITKANLVNYIKWAISCFPINTQDTTIITTSLAYDLSYTGLFCALMNRCSIVLPSKEVIRDPEYLINISLREYVTFLKTTPTVCSMLLKAENAKKFFSKLRILISGGEPINIQAIKEIYKYNSDILIYNHYGPCETTIGCCMKEYSKEYLKNYINGVIGKPIAQAKLYIVDDFCNVVEDGKIGHLLITGSGVGNGYINSIEEEHSYIEWKGRKAYISDDIAKKDENGEFILIGRNKTFTKYNGYRISLEEIRHYIYLFAKVDYCYVHIEEMQERDAIVCYYKSEKVIDYLSLKKKLLLYLPNYMIPKAFCRIKKLGYDNNGKFSLRYSLINKEEFEDFEDELLNLVYSCWLECGGYPRINPDISLFEYNLDSLSMLEYVISLEEKFPNCTFTYNTIIMHNTLNKLAKYIKRKRTVNYCNQKSYSIQRLSYKEWSNKWDKTSNEYEVRRLPLTQQYYCISGILKDVIISSVKRYNEAIDVVEFGIQKLIYNNWILRASLKTSGKIYVKDFIDWREIPIINYPIEDLSKELLKEIYLWFKEKQPTPFLPICFQDNTFTFVIFLFLHEYCKSDILENMDEYFYESSNEQKKISQYKASNILYNKKNVTLAQQYIKSYLEFKKHFFLRIRSVKYVSEYVEIPISLIHKLGGSINEFLIWLTGNTILEMTNSDVVPIKIWIAYMENEEKTALDTSDFHFFLVKKDEGDYEMSYNNFLDKNAECDIISLRDMYPFLEAFNEEISVYINLQTNNNLLDDEGECWVKQTLKTLKVSSIHGICFYGYIDANKNAINICYSSNYKFPMEEKSAIIMHHIIKKLVDNQS